MMSFAPSLENSSDAARPMPLLDEALRAGAPDAAASTCDDDGFAFEAAHEILPVMSAGRRLPPCGISNKISNARSLEAMTALTYSDSEQY